MLFGYVFKEERASRCNSCTTNEAEAHGPNKGTQRVTILLQRLNNGQSRVIKDGSGKQETY